MLDDLSPQRLAQRCFCGNDEPTKFKRYIYPPTDKFIGILCLNCDAEWLVEEAVGVPVKENTDTLELNQRSLKQYDFPNAKCVSEAIGREHITTISQLKEGDHFAFERPYCIWHHGIVYNIDKENEKFEAIHWNKIDKKITIEKSWIRLDKKQGKLYRIEYNEEINKASSVELVIARALSRIGDDGYKLWKDNCEHFASFCKVGCAMSLQVRNAIVSTVRAVCGSLGNTASKVALYIGSRRTAAYFTAESLELGFKATTVIGGVIVLAVESVMLIIDLNKIYNERKDNQIGWKEFVKSCVVRISEAIFATSVAVTLGTGLQLAGAAIGTLVCPGLGTVVGGFICGVVGGVLGSVIGKVVGNVTGTFVGDFIVKYIKVDDRSVDNIGELQRGDHIVLYANLFHPRCHMIVVDHDNISKVNVIRSLYQKGVVMETIKFVKPIYKVQYDENECTTIEKTIERAESKLSTKNKYNLLTNNCKDFAKWCKSK